MVFKRKKSAVLQKKPDLSESDSETDDRKPKKKLLKTNRNGIQFSSTPHSNSTPFFDGPSTSFALPQNGNASRSEDNPSDCNYANFTSFLESQSFLSDDESDLLTVSRLAERRLSTPIQNNTSQKSITSLNNSVQNLSMEISLNKPKVLKVPHKNLEVISAQHPTSLTLHGYLKMRVLVGTVSVLGYDVKAGNSIPIFSSKRSGYKKMTTKMSVVRIDPIELVETLKSLTGIEEKDSQEETGPKKKPLTDYVNCIGSFTVVFVLEKALLPPSLQFLELYFPNAVEMDIPKQDAKGSDMYSKMDSSVIEVSPGAELIADQLNQEFLKAGACILVHGAKQSGKSTMLRYLINTLLNTNSKLYYLDTDPGQTEFTPPGAVSLIEVTKPILGPPYSHQSIPVKMIFTGSITPATSPPVYIQAIRTLMEYFEANFRTQVLFVNTIGWVEGIGEKLFQSVKEIVKPTMLIDFLSTEECPALQIEKNENNLIYVQLPIKKYLRQSSYSAKDMREFALMSYFGKCQKYYMKPTYINEFRPVCVKWDDIAIAVIGQRVELNRLIEAIHCSIVALCHVDETQILISGNPALPRTLQNESINECLGYGLVIAVNETEHTLYVVTPLSVDQLLKVNSLVKGNIIIPDEVFLKQPIFNTRLPYTMESKTPTASINRSVKKRTFIPQQTTR